MNPGQMFVERVIAAVQPKASRVLTDDKRPANSWDSLLTHPSVFYGFFAVYALLCVIFFKQRLHFDSARTLFCLVQENRPELILGRYATEFPQVLPWLGLVLNASLETCALLFSIGFCVFHLGIAMLLYHGFKRRDVALAFQLYVLVFLTRDFFYPACGSVDGAAFLFPAFVALQARPTGRWHQAGAFTTAFISIYLALNSHLLSVGLMGVIAGILLLAESRLCVAAVAGSAASAIAYAIEKWHGFAGYENDKLATISVDTLTTSVSSNLYYLLQGHSLLVALLLYGSFRFWQGSRSLVRTGTLVVLFMAYFTVVFSYIAADKNSAFYIWAYMAPVYAPVFLLTIAKRANGKALFGGQIKAVTTGIVVCLAVYGINRGLQFVRIREKDLVELIKVLPAGERYFAVDRSISEANETRLMDWALPYEVALATSWRAAAGTRVVVTAERWPRDEFSAWGRRGFREKYFGLPAGPVEFALLNHTEAREEVLRRAKTDLTVEKQGPYTKKRVGGLWRNYATTGETMFRVPVVIKNAGQVPFRSRIKGGGVVTIGYTWIKDKERQFMNIKADTLAIDVAGEYRQYIDVRTRGIPEGSELVVDLYVDGRGLTRPEIQRLPAAGEFYGWRSEEFDQAREVFKRSLNDWSFENRPGTGRRNVLLQLEDASRTINGRTLKVYMIDLPPEGLILKQFPTDVIPSEQWKVGAWLWIEEVSSEPNLQFQVYREGGKAEGKAIRLTEISTTPQRFEVEHTFEEWHERARVLIANKGQQTIRLYLAGIEFSMTRPPKQVDIPSASPPRPF